MRFKKRRSINLQTPHQLCRDFDIRTVYSADRRGTLGGELPITQGVQLMKYVIATAFSALLLGTALAPAMADDQPSTDPARHRMGDEGKLPATNSTTTRVPEMGAGTGESSGTSGRHRMGDEGTLPATGNTSTRVPEQGAGTENPK